MLIMVFISVFLRVEPTVVSAMLFEMKKVFSQPNYLVEEFQYLPCGNLAKGSALLNCINWVS